MSLSTPRAFLELVDLAAARGVPSDKYTKGLGAVRMSIATRDEDPVTLATDAATRMFDRGDVDPARIGFCAVGTETGIDHSKPIASYMHGLLGLPQRCRVFDAKHACFGGTAALQAACEWIASGAAKGRSALVVCTDIARYELGSPGEPTQGAGAVAMLVSERPRLLEIEVGHSGSFARDVHDFWRPLHRRDALVDGHFSVSCYLDALAGAFADWREEETRRGGGDPLVRSAYHVPYVKMAKKADRHRALAEGLDEAAAEARFAEQVGSSLAFASEVGNVYTGSLYMALASMLHAEAASIEGSRVGIFSYGSGCGAEFFAARVALGAARFAKQLDLDGPLRDRVRLSVEEYEIIRRADRDEASKAFAIDESQTTGSSDRTAFLGMDDAERRVYRPRAPSSGIERVSRGEGEAASESAA
jgi:hydroxymethylglutaryl-CoA synthase